MSRLNKTYREPRNRPTHLERFDTEKRLPCRSWGQGVAYPHGTGDPISTLHHTQKSSPVGCKTKCLEENMGEWFYDLEVKKDCCI